MTEDELVQMINGLPDDTIVEVPARFLRELIALAESHRAMLPKVQQLEQLMLRLGSAAGTH